MSARAPGAPEPPEGPAPRQRPDARRAAAWTFALVSAGGVVMTLDVTVVNVALAAIARDLGAGLHQVQWTVSAYSLAFGALLLTAGALSDRVGRRSVFVAGITLFTLASALCGLAPDAGTLVAARVAQGLGGAMVFAPALALIAAVYEGAERQRAIATYAAIASAAGALGPVVGGVLVEWVGWRWIFLVNIPIGVGVVLGAMSRMPALTPQDTSRRLDVLGALLAVGMLLSLHYPLVRGADVGWGSPQVLVPALAGFVLLAALVASQRRPGGMLDLELLRIPALSGAAVLGFLARMSGLGVLVFTTLWLQRTADGSPLRVGLQLLPLTGSLLVVGLCMTWLQARVSAAVLVAGGFVFQGAGLGMLALATLSGASSWTGLGGLVLMGAGGALIFPPLMGVAVGVVPSERAGMASGLTNACYPLGTATGVAVFGAVFSSRLTAMLSQASLPRDVARHLRTTVETGQFDAIVPTFLPLAHAAFGHAYFAVCVVAAAVCLGGAVLALHVLSNLASRAPRSARPDTSLSMKESP
ncbi:MFS transporter [Myxococcus sp. K15C18031901]|uniref:MFS transporter n=1 Tax=Myxococcus dinghuensis TaxID=2906761 RepID=UPI0020A6F9E2|nr:MFS transporter [Myxococcus dinghuensis]MCP3097914.1 MFS transporter [Myxococcus dinghuensis]